METIHQTEISIFPMPSGDGNVCDGIGFVAALIAAGCDPRGKRGLLVEAGGAGSTIGHALMKAGGASLDIRDNDEVERVQTCLGHSSRWRHKWSRARKYWALRHISAAQLAPSKDCLNGMVKRAK